MILEQNYEKERLIAKVIKIYTPYCISISRCPPLTLKVMALPGKRGAHFPLSFHSHKKAKRTLWHITDEEFVGGYTIASFLNFKLLGLSASISGPGEECFGPDTELSPLGDMVTFFYSLLSTYYLTKPLIIDHLVMSGWID